MTREEAIEFLNTDDYESKGYNDAVIMAIEALKEQRPHGEWIYDMFDENYHCSECGKECGSPYDFCPNCGSDNRGEGEAE